jgi:glycosyltransferase involved in cell wall biosynthesis
MPSSRQPRIWINVTTSANWNRPAVGIVRVERSLVEHLQRQLGQERCRLCVWRDDQFVEWVPPAASVPSQVIRAVDTILPRTASFEVARPFLVRAMQRFSRSDSGLPEVPAVLKVVLPLSAEPPPQPMAGDFLISVGLDWDMPFTRRFHEMAKRQGLRIITCCYDLIPVLFPQYCVGEVAQRFTEYFLDLSWGSEAVLCISRQTERDYLTLCDELGAPRRRTVVIPLGDNIPSAIDGVGEEVRSTTASPFILFVSTIERRKNHEVLYRAYHLLARRGLSQKLPRLVFVGMPGWGVGDLLKDIELDPLVAGLIVQLNHVSDSELGVLYQKAAFCVFPSLYEGWGLPVGEALAAGKAVIASGEGSLPEVGGDLVRYVSAWSPYDWADAIREYLEHPELVRESEDRVRKQYVPRRWSDTASTVRKLIDDLLQQGSGTSRELLPGYECSTQCGVHVGPSIRSAGKAGFLLFGPHMGLPRGRYDVEISARLLDGHRGNVLVEVASASGTEVRFAKQITMRDASAGPQAIGLAFELDHDVSDLEIRCVVTEVAAIQFDRILVRSAHDPSGTVHPSMGYEANDLYIATAGRA